jgi:hypothetical protein
MVKAGLTRRALVRMAAPILNCHLLLSGVA